MDFRWCGEALNPGCLAYGLDSAETEFLVPDGSDHWVLLVPKDKLVRYLGEETAAAVLRNRHVLRCEPNLGLQLFAMVDRVIGRLQTDSGLRADNLTLNAIESQLLGTVAEILLADDEGAGCSTPRKRYLACRRAIGCVDGLRKPITVPELAATVGVSERVLELSFKETLGISPRKYMRWNRMNLLHRDLRAALRDDATVTELAHRWGFHELGRTAVEYGQLFGESPSGTLTRNPSVASKRLADILLE
jgi:AraC-like DNA-binding protein